MGVLTEIFTRSEDWLCGLGNHIEGTSPSISVSGMLAGNDDLSLAGMVSKDAIDSLTRQIRAIEVAVEKKIDLRKPYDLLLSMPGVGRVLALTIMMETGPIDRFREAGHYVSYCRKVPSSAASP